MLKNKSAQINLTSELSSVHSLEPCVGVLH